MSLSDRLSPPKGVRVGDVLEAIDRRAPFRTAAGWDTVGLQIGDPERPFSTVGVAHELTQTVVEKVLARGVDLVITYHPLVFRPLRSVTAVAGPEGRAFSLVEGGVSVISIHTNWDVAPGGTSDSLAEVLELKETEVFGTFTTATDEPGWVGRYGAFDGTPAELVQTVRVTLGARPRVAGFGEGRLQKVAVVPGSGGSHVDDAIATGADAYITGDLSHHEARRAVDHNMAVIDAGHGPSERPGLAALYSMIAEIVDNPVDFAGVDDDPWEVEWNR